MSTKIYTAYEKADLPEAADRVVLVREGFSWLALIFGPLWLLARGLWIALLGYVLLIAAVGYIGESFGLSDAGMLLIQLFVQLTLAFSANDLVRESLTRRGYRFQNIVVAESTLAAERRYYDVAV